MTEYNKLLTFLEKHKTTDKQNYTHTSMGEPYGSFNISNDKDIKIYIIIF